MFRLLRLVFRLGKPRTSPPRRPPIVSQASVTIVRAERSVQAVNILRGRCWVIDGDTIVIGKDNIRIAGIDAPELDHPYGKNAKWAMVQLCRNQTISVQILDETSHNRLVGICTLPDGRDLAAELVKQGLAIDWPKYSGGRYRQFEHAQARQKLWRAVARQQGRMPTPAGRRHDSEKGR